MAEETEVKKFKALEAFEIPSEVEGEEAEKVAIGDELELTEAEAETYAGKVEAVIEPAAE